MNQPHDSTPGLWQDDRRIIALQHIMQCAWYKNQHSVAEPCERKIATMLRVWFAGNHTSFFDITNLEKADSFVQALNLYWETRT